MGALRTCVRHAPDMPDEPESTAPNRPSWHLAWVGVPLTSRTEWEPLQRTANTCMLVALYNPSNDPIRVEMELPGGHIKHESIIGPKAAVRVLSDAAPVMVCQSSNPPRMRGGALSDAAHPNSPFKLMALYVEARDRHEMSFWARENHCFVCDGLFLLYRAGIAELVSDTNQIRDHEDSHDQYVTRTYLHLAS